jgi:cysteine dioxygenase
MVHWPNEISLPWLLEELDRFDHRIPLDVLAEGLKRCRVDIGQFEPFMRFSRDSYRRNMLHAGAAYHALVLCWRAGQRSPIHDHRGSSCGVRVLKGTCTETSFELTPSGHLIPVSTHQLSAGECCATQDADIHQVSNLGQPGEDLVTLHIYSPPLLVMGQYSLTNATRSEFIEPSFFGEGAGI